MSVSSVDSGSYYDKIFTSKVISAIGVATTIEAANYFGVVDMIREPLVGIAGSIPLIPGGVIYPLTEGIALTALISLYFYFLEDKVQELL